MKPIAIALLLVAVLVLVGGLYWQSQQKSASPVATNTGIVPPATNTGIVPPAGPTPWRCASLLGKDANIMRRRADKSLECATMDGKNCYWYADMNACNAAFPAVNKDANAPLNCAGSHVTLYSDERSNPQHWCYNGRTDM